MRKSNAALDAFRVDATDEREDTASVSGERPVQTNTAWAAGHIVADRYRLEDQVGEGGMSRVFSAFDLVEERMVALKIVSFDRGEREQLEARFKREVEVATQLKGPAFVPMCGHGMRPECAYLVLELLHGESLQMRLSREGRLDRNQALLLLRGIASGLAVAHELCIVHRDLKPSNVFYAKEPDGTESVRLLDFGIAKDLWKSSTLTMSGTILGSPHYVSPEQAKGIEIDHRTDLWSLAVILYRALTGLRPFDGPLSRLVLKIVNDKHTPPTRIVPTLPSELDAFFETALAKKAENRFHDIGALVAAFEEAVSHWTGGAAAERPAGESAARDLPNTHPGERAARTTDRTQAAAASYEAYAAMVTGEEGSSDRISAHPTVEIAAAILTGTAGETPNEAVDAAAGPLAAGAGPGAAAVSATSGDSPWIEPKATPESEKKPATRWINEASIGAAFLVLLALVVVWVLTR